MSAILLVLPAGVVRAFVARGLIHKRRVDHVRVGRGGQQLRGQVFQNLAVLFVHHAEQFVEEHEMLHEDIDVALQAEEDQVLEVSVVDMGHHLEQVDVHFLHLRVEIRREMLAWNRRETIIQVNWLR